MLFMFSNLPFFDKLASILQTRDKLHMYMEVATQGAKAQIPRAWAQGLSFQKPKPFSSIFQDWNSPEDAYNVRLLAAYLKELLMLGARFPRQAAAQQPCKWGYLPSPFCGDMVARITLIAFLQ